MTGDGPSVPAQVGPTRHIVVMGVSGSGKTTVAQGIAAATGFTFVEADDFHPPANVELMRAGVPLDDAHRWPWLHELARWMTARAAEGVSTVLACSALRRAYRDVLRQGPPSLDFVLLDGPAAMIRQRLALRKGHYMPASLLDSQIATLERPEVDERIVTLDVSLPPDTLVTAALNALRM